MTAKYRIRESHHWFTPQRKILGFWINIASPQPSIGLASRLLKERMEPNGPPPEPPRAAQPAELPPVREERKRSLPPLPSLPPLGGTGH